jgi:hypothetical protein
VHDTHHPISSELYYEDQGEPAKARAAAFLANRVPKYLGYFERALQHNPHGPALRHTSRASGFVHGRKATGPSIGRTGPIAEWRLSSGEAGKAVIRANFCGSA